MDKKKKGALQSIPGWTWVLIFPCSSCSVMVCIIYQPEDSTKLPIYPGNS